MSAALSSGALRELTIGGDPPLTAILGIPDNPRGIVTPEAMTYAFLVYYDDSLFRPLQRNNYPAQVTVTVPIHNSTAEITVDSDSHLDTYFPAMALRSHST